VTWRDGPAAERWIPVLNAAEAKTGIPHDLLARQCYEESSFNPSATNPSGAVGLMQLLPKYFPGAGQDPVKDISTAAQYLKSIYSRFADWQLALAGYDWGPSAVEKWKSSAQPFSSMPLETQKYVIRIITDVPVKGVLCKIPSLPNPLLTGSLPVQSSAALPLEQQLPNSLWHSVTNIFTRRSAQNLPAQSPLSVSQSRDTLSQTIKTQPEEISMSTPNPNPVLVAAAPAIINGLNAVKQFSTDIGPDPVKWTLLLPGALVKLLGTFEMQIPLVISGEAGALQTVVNAKVDELIAKVNAAIGHS
jgi:hypothetical protein